MLLASVFSINRPADTSSVTAVTPCHQVKTSDCGNTGNQSSINKYLSLHGVLFNAYNDSLVTILVLLIALMASLTFIEPLIKPPKS